MEPPPPLALLLGLRPLPLPLPTGMSRAERRGLQVRALNMEKKWSTSINKHIPDRQIRRRTAVRERGGIWCEIDLKTGH